MDIPNSQFIRHAQRAAAEKGSPIKVERKGSGAAGYDIRIGDRRRATIWTITNTRSGVSTDVVSTDELMPADVALATCKSLDMRPPDSLAKPAPSYAADAFIAYLKTQKVQVTFKPKQAGYELKRGTLRPDYAYLRAPGHTGDPDFAAKFLHEVVRVCEVLDVSPPPDILNEDGVLSEALLVDALLKENENIRITPVPQRNSFRFEDISDSSIEAVEVPAAAERPGWITAGHVMYACNAMRARAPTDTPESMVPQRFLGRARTRRLLTDGIGAARERVELNDADTEIVEVLANLVEDHSDARPDGKTLTQRAFREDREKKGDPEDPNRGDRERHGADRGHGPGEAATDRIAGHGD